MRRADPTTGTRPSDEAPGGPAIVPPTVVLLVRHGTTTTTGKELPGRAPGLHLSDAGRRQADGVADRIVAWATRRGADRPTGDRATGDGDRAAAGGRADPRDGGPAGDSGAAGARQGENAEADPGGAAMPRVAAVYASPLERTRETAAPVAAALGLDVDIDEGLLELDVGDWTGLALAEAAERPEWSTIQRYPSGFTFPGGESFVTMQSRIVATLDRLRRRHPGRAVVAVSHADPIRAAVAHAMGTHLDLFQRVVVSPCSLTAIAYGDGGPTVLTVNATGGLGSLVPA